MPNCNESVVIKAFQRGFLCNQSFYDFLTMENSTSISKVLHKTNKFIKLEDDKRQY